MKKKEVHDIEIVDIADKGKAIGKKDGQVYLLENAVPGDLVNALILRKRKGMLAGKVTAFNKLSEQRTTPECVHFGTCGGCKWQNFTYSGQLQYKLKHVEDCLTRIAKVNPEKCKGILGAENTYHYRNKLEYTFSTNRWLTQEEVSSQKEFDRNALGFHLPGRYNRILHIDNCLLQPEPSNSLRNDLHKWARELNIPYYDVEKHSGVLRNVIIRTSSVNQIMIILSASEKNTQVEKLLNLIIEKYKPTSLYFVQNQKLNDTIVDLEHELIAGEKYIEEKLGEIRYKIGPKSFFQTNTEQTIKLYNLVKEYANIQPSDTVFDLYTGLGSIALYLAQLAKKTVGIETIQEAIDLAKLNASFNHIENAHFYAGDVADIFNSELVQKYGQPDILIIDPPRAGMHQKVIDQILKIKPQKIVYVSCNASTQARDIALLTDYKLEKYKAVDMFPHTNHVESVALLYSNHLDTLQ